MLIYVDIDNTICTTDGMDYYSSRPILCAIHRINEYYDKGATVVYWTARGTVSGIDWTGLTKSQLSEWGAKYHDLKFGKPAWDIFIDDKNLNAKDWLNSQNLDILND